MAAAAGRAGTAAAVRLGRRDQGDAQRGGELAAGAVPVARLLGHGLADHGVDGGRQFGADRSHWRHVVPYMREQDCDGVLALERQGPGEEAEGNAAERVLVAGPADRLAGDLLGGTVVRRAHEHAGRGQPRGTRRGLDEPEVGQVGLLRAAGDVVDEDVAGLDVPVHQPDRVRGIQSRGHLGDDVGHPVGGKRAAVGAHESREVPAGDEPGGDVQHAVGFASGVDGQDVRFVDGGDGARLAQEPGPEVLVGR